MCKSVSVCTLSVYSVPRRYIALYYYVALQNHQFLSGSGGKLIHIRPQRSHRADTSLRLSINNSFMDVALNALYAAALKCKFLLILSYGWCTWWPFCTRIYSNLRMYFAMILFLFEMFGLHIGVPGIVVYYITTCITAHHPYTVELQSHVRANGMMIWWFLLHRARM